LYRVAALASLPCLEVCLDLTLGGERVASAGEPSELPHLACCLRYQLGRRPEAIQGVLTLVGAKPVARLGVLQGIAEDADNMRLRVFDVFGNAIIP